MRSTLPRAFPPVRVRAPRFHRDGPAVQARLDRVAGVPSQLRHVIEH